MNAQISHRVWLPSCCAALLALAGCTQSPPPQFKLNMEGVVPADYKPEQRQQVVDALVAMFGDPQEPYVYPGTNFDLKKLALAAGPSYSEQNGTRHGLFRKHCAHCHGVTGDGLGPTARFLTPYPRDFRKGVFKFTSTGQGQKPTREDLKRTLLNGIPGTAMPSFALYPDDEVEALIEYVMYLSVRGESEGILYDLVVNQEEKITRELLTSDAIEPIIAKWNDAAQNIVIPPERTTPVDTPEALAASIEAGRALFLDAKRAKCNSCHGPTGLGDGNDPIFDIWNEPKKGANLEARAKLAPLFSLPIQELQPRNLRLGVYRGGRRPVDLYRRIHSGIKGTPMPATGPSAGNAGVLKPFEIWQLIDFVRSLPYDTIDPYAPGAATPAEERLARQSDAAAATVGGE